MPLGEHVKELRKEMGWSQSELADKVGTDARQVSRYENGRITPSLDVLVRIAEVFNVSLDYLVVEDVPRRRLHARRGRSGRPLRPGGRAPRGRPGRTAQRGRRLGGQEPVEGPRRRAQLSATTRARTTP